LYPGLLASFASPTLFVEGGACMAQCADGSVLRLVEVELDGRRLAPRDIGSALGPVPFPLPSRTLSLT